ncbi:MAG: hypothetical protein NT154_20055, partial [Verrucomicrobia bacterium]|nr:hypothetical protein [Verrucomicrobiota bacterium]
FAFTLPVTQAFAPNTNAIVIPDPAAPNPSYLTGSGPAKPYPSTLNVSNFVGTLGKVTLTLSNVNHSYPPDINVLLVAPGGAKALVMSHAGDQPTVKGVNLTFDDFAPAPIPASGALATGVWQPSVYTNAFSPTPNFPTNDPGPYPKVLSALNGVNPNGAWKLYVYDDGSGDIGAISNGWSLALTSITPVNQLADLGLTAVVAPIPALAGGDLTYAFTITNNGPNSANAVAFTCTLPKGTTFKSAAPANNYILAGQTVTFTNLGSLAKGTSAFVSIVATPEGMSTTILTLTATATANETDLNPANNTVSVVTIVNQPVANLELQTVEPTNSVFAGLGFTNTVTITNHGPDTAFDVVLTNSFFSTNLSFDSDLLPQGTVIVDGTNLVSSLGALASGQGATVTIAVKPSVSFTGTNTSAILINLASVTTSSSDPNPNDSSKTNYITVVNPGPGIISAGATLNYESGPVNGAIDPDETVTLSLGLANDGALSTSNLIAILHTTGGVTTDTTNRPCILTNFYGALPSGGGSTARGFTFKATFDSSGALVATLHCQDTSLGYSTNVSFTFTNPVTTTWSSSGRITIPYFGAATPYPASINVANLEGQVVNGATVTLYHLTHSFPHDVNVLLVSPSGSNVLVMSHTGGGHGVTNLSLTFEDGAAGYLPNYDAITAGTTYRPTAYEGPVILPGNPVSMPYGSTLSALNGSSADGPWRLYVYDDFDGDSGVISGGWSLALSTAPPLTVAYEQPLPPVLSGSVSNGLFNLTVVGQPGFEYIVQGSTDLTSWVPLSTNANTTGSFIYSETNSLPFRFYRALRQ